MISRPLGNIFMSVDVGNFIHVQGGGEAKWLGGGGYEKGVECPRAIRNPMLPNR